MVLPSKPKLRKMNLKKLFLFATFFEAQALLKQGNFQKIERNYFKKENLEVLITGIGQKQVEKTLKKHQPTCDIAINIGLCGGIKNLNIGDIFIPTTIFTEEELQSNNILNSSVLITLLKPFKNLEDFLKQWSFNNNADYLGADLEAGYLQTYFKKQNISFISMKVVSDLGEEDFKTHFLQRKPLLEKRIENVVKKQL